MANKTEYLHIRIEPELKKKAEEKAKEDCRTLSGYVANLIKKDLEKSGE